MSYLNEATNAIIPLLILISLGYLSRRFHILRKGDERVLSSYVYYFALPALFFISISSIEFNMKTILFILAGILPGIFMLTVYAIIYKIFHIKREVFFLLSLTTIFGSLAFFGIPFIIFVMPEAEAEAALAAATISITSVIASITLLEIYGSNEKVLGGMAKVIKNLSINPLIISIFLGLIFSLLAIPVPSVISRPLHMLGRSTSVVAIFMLGVFLFGRKYANMKLAFLLSMIRMALLPSIAFFIAKAFMLPHQQFMVSVLMNAMPLAISLIVLSERYNFCKETVASAILISSLASIVYLNIWLFILS